MGETFRFERFAGARVLEIGVGLGTDHMQLARGGARLTGIDLTQRCVDLTRARLEQEGYKPDVRVMDAEDLEFPGDSFDVVYSFGVLHHVPSTERAFAEVRRVLRPRGAFIGALYSRESLAYARFVFAWVISGRFLSLPHDEMLSGLEFGDSGALPQVRLFTREELRGLLRASGFQRVALKRRHAGLGRLTPYVPAPVERALGRTAGWYLVHEAT
jgi:ubiquinone/menaquinone biosynthesis C-methylase UbiE